MNLKPPFSAANLIPERQVSLLIRVAAVAIAASFILSWKLWITSRLFPLIPVSNQLPPIPYPFDYIWFLTLLALLAAISAFARPRTLILVFLCLTVALSLWDQMRWQPWFYLYLSILAVVGLFAGWKKPATARNQAALDACRLTVASTYLWTGIQKLNVTFIRETWPDMASFLPGVWQSIVKQVPSFAILIIPLVEILVGVGLLTIRFRDRAVLLATATHGAILILLVLTGENVVVWPWNVAMVLFVWILFWRDQQTSARKILVGKKAFHWLVLLLFGVLPAFSFFGLWDSYLSSSIYSGSTDQAAIYLSPAVLARLPTAIHPHVWQSSQPFFLDVNRWAYAELRVPINP
ncbi:MAG TPA: hypothetical protein VH188_07020, partial [Chthoniobacterales bacterium]|nr:hypothetical protein [Chthoniobacterales bacterium]